MSRVHLSPDGQRGWSQDWESREDWPSTLVEKTRGGNQKNFENNIDQNNIIIGVVRLVVRGTAHPGQLQGDWSASWQAWCYWSLLVAGHARGRFPSSETLSER